MTSSISIWLPFIYIYIILAFLSGSQLIYMYMISQRSTGDGTILHMPEPLIRFPLPACLRKRMSEAGEATGSGLDNLIPSNHAATLYSSLPSERSVKASERAESAAADRPHTHGMGCPASPAPVSRAVVSVGPVVAASRGRFLAIIPVSPVIQAILAVVVDIVTAFTLACDRERTHEHERNL